MKKGILFLVLAVLVLASCSHTHQFKDGYYFQAMGEEAEIVVTVDTQKLLSKKPELLGFNDSLLKSMVDKSTRLSFSLSQDSYSDDDRYPANISDMNISGAVEGDYSKLMINTGLSFSKEFSKVKEEGVSYYTNLDNSLKLASPKSGIILFSNDDYLSLYNRTYKNRVIKISNETAALLGESVVGLYVRSPETMIALGFEIPKSVIVQMKDAILYVVENEDVYTLYAQLSMDDAKLAKTLNTLLRNQVVAELKRVGEKPDFKALGAIYQVEGDAVLINGRVMSENEVSSFFEQVKVASGSLL